MTKDDFFAALMQVLQLPFTFEDVDDVEENCGTVWVTLKNGDVYYITCNKSVFHYSNERKTAGGYLTFVFVLDSDSCF